MIDGNNPAGRLHNILTLTKGWPDSDKIIHVWASVLGIEEDNVLVTKAVIELYSLSEEIQRLIMMNGDLNHDLYLKSFRSIRNIFFPLNLSSHWGSVSHYLTDEAMTRLQFCAEELSKYYSEESLSKEDLEEIIQKIEDLFEAVSDSTFPDALKLSLLEEVERLRHSVRMYTIKGAKGLKQALQATIGTVVTSHEELKAASRGNGDVLLRLGALIDKLDSFTARALKVQKLLSKPISFLVEKITGPTASDGHT